MAEPKKDLATSDKEFKIFKILVTSAVSVDPLSRPYPPATHPIYRQPKHHLNA